MKKFKLIAGEKFKQDSILPDINYVINSARNFTFSNPDALEAFCKCFEDIECRDYGVSFVFMSPSRFSEFRKIISSLNNGIFVLMDDVDLLKMGVVGVLWGAMLCINRKIPRNKIFFVGEEMEDNQRIVLALEVWESVKLESFKYGKEERLARIEHNLQSLKILVEGMVASRKC